jgi:hypothetical protein
MKFLGFLSYGKFCGIEVTRNFHIQQEGDRKSLDNAFDGSH